MDIDVLARQVAQLIAFKNRFEPHLVEAYPEPTQDNPAGSALQGGSPETRTTPDSPSLPGEQPTTGGETWPGGTSSGQQVPSETPSGTEEPKTTMSRADLETMAVDEGMSEEEAKGFTTKQELVDAILEGRK
jgi:hypothetical protein